jgi:hypothetical protein
MWPYENSSSGETIRNRLDACKLLNAAGADGWELVTAEKSEQI